MYFNPGVHDTKKLDLLPAWVTPGRVYEYEVMQRMQYARVDVFIQQQQAKLCARPPV